MASFHIYLQTCNRPNECKSLLQSIAKQKGDRPVTVEVFNNASQASYQVVDYYLSSNPWAKKTGIVKRRKDDEWWMTWNEFIQKSKPLAKTVDYFVFISDEIEIAKDFLDRIENYWSGIPNTNALVFNLYATETGVKVDGIKAESISVQEHFVCRPMMFTILPEIKRASDPLLVMSRKLLPFGYVAYEPMKSPIRYRAGCKPRHIDRLVIETAKRLTSRPAPKPVLSRKPNPLLHAPRPAGPPTVLRDAAFFSKRLAAGMIVASMASIPSRSKNLPAVVYSILPQVDKLHVFLNGYGDVPPILNNPKIVVARSQDHGDLSDAGKFFWCEEIEGYHFTIDDDIIYPRDYVQTMIIKLNKYNNRAIVCVHGTLFQSPLPKSWVRSRGGFHFMKSLEKDRRVNVPGTATVAYHSSAIELTMKCFPPKNIADLFLAIAAKEQIVPIYAIAREAKWLNEIQDSSNNSIYDQALQNDEEQSKILSRYSPWRVYRQKKGAIKLGMILRGDDGGLARISQDFYKHIKPDKVIIVDVGRAPLNLKAFPDIKPEIAPYKTQPCPSRKLLESWMEDLDVILTFETPYNWDLFDMARERGIRTVLMVDYEYLKNPLPSRADVLWMPVKWHLDDIQRDEGGATFIPMPVDRDRFVFKERTKAKTFVSVLGHPHLAEDRGGVNALLAAIPLVRNRGVRFILRSIQEIPRINDPRVTVDISRKDNPEENWTEGDVFLHPRRYAGMSLPMDEALSCGMPVLMTDMIPQNGLLPAHWLFAPKNVKPFLLCRDVEIAEQSPRNIAAMIDQWAGRDIRFESQLANQIAEENSWKRMLPTIKRMLFDE